MSPHHAPSATGQWAPSLAREHPPRTCSALWPVKPAIATNCFSTKPEVAEEVYRALSIVFAPSETTTGAGEMPSRASRTTRSAVL